MNKLKRLEDKEVVVVNQSWSEEERKKFSEFLKNRKKARVTRDNKVKRVEKPRHNFA